MRRTLRIGIVGCGNVAKNHLIGYQAAKGVQVVSVFDVSPYKLHSLKLLPGQTHFATIPTVLPDSGDVTHHPFDGEIDHFVECIVQNKESHANLEDTVKTHEICFAADISAREGRPVKLPLID